MFRPYYYIFILLAIVPGLIKSEQPTITIGSQHHSPVEILFSGITPTDSSSAAIMRVSGSTEDISSTCEGDMTYKNKTRDNLIVSWKPTGICKVPLIYFRGKHYILPINGYFPDESTLSDLSTETLKNTLDAGSFLKNDFRLSSFKVRTFYTQIESVLSARNTRFSLPIPGTSVPTKTTYLPGSSRPFRADATDGIHHGWDFYVSEGTPVHAIEEGIILHVKRDFSWEEMKHLQPGHTDLEEQENLDVYRGNTVYLKTRSGHVAIYAHLSDIPSHITTGKSVNRGDILGHVGDSAVPDKKYLYHLHFELAMNPFIDEKAGQHTFSDVLLWPFWGKGKSADWIRANDDKLFE